MITVNMVTYNSKEVTLVALNSIIESLAKSGLCHEIIVIDNNSTDRTDEEIKKRYPYIKLVSLQENIGFARAHNLAIELSKGEFIFIVNSDIVIKDDVFEKLQNILLNNSEIDVVAPKVNEADGSSAPTSRDRLIYSRRMVALSIINKFFTLTTRREASRISPWFKRLIFKSHESVVPNYSSREVEWIDGMFLCVRRSAIKKVGLFDSFYFFDHEIGDFLQRVSLISGKIYYSSESEVTHLGGYSRQRNPKILEASIVGYLHYFYNNAPRYYAMASTLMILLAKIKVLIYTTRKNIDETAQWKKIQSELEKYRSNPVDRKYSTPKLRSAANE